jgi:hypothetical protein
MAEARWMPSIACWPMIVGRVEAQARAEGKSGVGCPTLPLRWALRRFATMGDPRLRAAGRIPEWAPARVLLPTAGIDAFPS